MRPSKLMFLLPVGIISGWIVSYHGGGAEPAPHFDPALHMTPEVERIIGRSCAACHVSGAQLPWYGYVPPASWMLERDMMRAQRSMNLGAWSQSNGKTLGLALGTLAALCADVESRRMPERKYSWMHPEARLSPEEVQTVCLWTLQQSERIRTERKLSRQEAINTSR